MDTIYFYSKNRKINNENVKRCYAMIDKYGFQPAIGLIKLVDTIGLDNFEICKITIVPLNGHKPLSIDNFDIKEEIVTNKSEKQKAKITVDAQHRQIAIAILEAEKKLKFEAEKMTELVMVPNNMNLESFIYCINSGRAWTTKDFDGTENSTGNPSIDYIESKRRETKLEPVVVYSFYTLGQPTIKVNVAKELKMGINKLPKSLKLNKTTQILGDKILEALRNSKMGESFYNNGRFAKGFKLFYDLYKPDLERLIEFISTIDKNFWFNNEKPEGSPEAKQYSEHFKKWFDKRYPDFNDDDKETYSEEKTDSVSEEDTTPQSDATPEGTVSKE